VESKCKAKTESALSETRDEIDFEVASSSRGIKVKVEHAQESETEDSERVSETQLEVYFDSLIEFSKATGSNELEGYNWEEDEVVQTIDLSSWDDFLELDSSYGVTHKFSVSSEDGMTVFHFTLSNTDVNEQVQANSIKIDFSLKEFPWTREDTDVALLSTVETKCEIEAEYERESGDVANTRTADITIPFADVLDAESLAPFGEYKWAGEAIMVPDIPANLTEGANSTDVIARSAAAEEVPAIVRVIATSPIVEPEERKRRRIEADEIEEDEEEEEEEMDEDANGEEVEDAEDKEAETDEDDETVKEKEDAKEVKIQSVAFTFVGEGIHDASGIFWDPQAGVSYESANANSGASIYGMVALGIGAMAALLL